MTGQREEVIRDAIANNKIVLGICLGSQLIADVLGDKVRRNLYKEIGLHPVKLTPEGRKSRIFSILPDSFIAFHWQGDTFDIPPLALRAVESEA